MLEKLVRFHPLVRRGLRFRSALEATKKTAPHASIEWYRYDSFANLFPIVELLKSANMAIDDLVQGRPILDAGAADGALAFYFEALGYEVHAVDNSGTNINRMNGIRFLASALESNVRIFDLNFDDRFEFPSSYGWGLFLGLLYHLKNPFYVLEKLAISARYCILSTRIARMSPDHRTAFGDLPIAYLLDSAEANNDATNYWIFSPKGLERLVNRSGWRILAKTSTGKQTSDPAGPENDERTFLLLSSAVGLERTK